MNQNFKISRVYPCTLSDLTSLIRLTDTTCMVSLPNTLIPVEPCQGATLNVKSEREDRVLLYTSTLSFLTTRDRTPASNQCYVCELTDGSRLVIGNSIAPYPVSTYEDKHGRPGDRTSKLREVTVVWKAPMPALEVI